MTKPFRRVAVLLAGLAVLSAMSAGKQAYAQSLTAPFPRFDASIPLQGATFELRKFVPLSVAIADPPGCPPFPRSLVIAYEISSSTTPGQDGTLANDFVIATGFLQISDADPGVYRTQQFPSPLGLPPLGVYDWPGVQPGVYYLQFSTTGSTCEPIPQNARLLSPTFTINVVSPVTTPPLMPTPVAPTSPPVQPSPPRTSVRLTASQARSVVPSMIRRLTGTRPRNLKRSCRLTGRTTAACSVQWWRGAARYKGTLSIRRTQTSYFATFRGTRMTKKCASTKNPRACTTRVRF